MNPVFAEKDPYYYNVSEVPEYDQLLTSTPLPDECERKNFGMSGKREFQKEIKDIDDSLYKYSIALSGAFMFWYIYLLYLVPALAIDFIFTFAPTVMLIVYWKTQKNNSKCHCYDLVMCYLDGISIFTLPFVVGILYYYFMMVGSELKVETISLIFYYFSALICEIAKPASFPLYVQGNRDALFFRYISQSTGFAFVESLVLRILCEHSSIINFKLHIIFSLMEGIFSSYLNVNLVNEASSQFFEHIKTICFYTISMRTCSMVVKILIFTGYMKTFSLSLAIILIGIISLSRNLKHLNASKNTERVFVALSTKNV